MIAIALFGAGCGQARDMEPSAPSITETPQETTAAPMTSATPSIECLPVSTAIREGIDAGPLMAVRAPERVKAWFISNAEGATWLTNQDPSDETDIGLILPLNDAARSASVVGTAARPDAPAYQGVTDDEIGAAESRRCASGQAP
jgi:hypothetical protein